MSGVSRLRQLGAAGLVVGAASFLPAVPVRAELPEALSQTVDLRSVNQPVASLIRNVFASVGLPVEIYGNLSQETGDWSAQGTLGEVAEDLSRSFSVCLFLDGHRVIAAPTHAEPAMVRSETHGADAGAAVESAFAWRSRNAVTKLPGLNAVRVCGGSRVSQVVQKALEMLDGQEVRVIRYGK